MIPFQKNSVDLKLKILKLVNNIFYPFWNRVRILQFCNLFYSVSLYLQSVFVFLFYTIFCIAKFLYHESFRIFVFYTTLCITKFLYHESYRTFVFYTTFCITKCLYYKSFLCFIQFSVLQNFCITKVFVFLYFFIQSFVIFRA